MLYNHLTGRAWRDAEELDLGALDAEDGVQIFTRWIEAKYLDKEVVKVGKSMSEFFKVLKKGSGQDIREFNQEFDRQTSRLREVGCNLPDLCLAWWYLDKLRLDNTSELSLLSSTGNTYELAKLQEAAIIQDRMNRRLWERRDYPKKQQALVTEVYDQDDDDGDDASDCEEEIPVPSDEETQQAYVAFQNAKSKYRAALRARGTNAGEKGMSSEDRLKAAKARSYCSACKQRGHWHKDAICPLNKGNDVKAAHTTHVVFFTSALENDPELYGITDCACSRTLAGTGWLAKYFSVAKETGIPYFPVEQQEVFKFGGKKLYPSDTAWVLWFNVEGKWLLVKVSEVTAEVPLLLSRAALAKMQMKYDLEANTADFLALGLRDVKLKTTASGHPALSVTGHGKHRRPDWPEVDWSLTEIWTPEPASAYMAERGSWRPVFYPKNLTTGVSTMLTCDSLQPETFMHWWRHCDHQRDFWIETPLYLDRIHVTPRKGWFNPEGWNTKKDDLKRHLLGALDGTRETSCIPCFLGPRPLVLQHDQHEWSTEGARMMWVGRSRFRRKPSGDVSQFEGQTFIHASRQDAMDYEEGRTPRGAEGDGRAGEQRGDGARTSVYAGGEAAGEDEAGRANTLQPGGVEGQVRGREHRGPGEGDQGESHAEVEGVPSSNGQRRGGVRAVHQLPVRRGAGGLPEVGGRGDGSEGHGMLDRLGAVGQLGGAEEGEDEERLPGRGSRPGGRSIGAAATQGESYIPDEGDEIFYDIDDADPTGYEGAGADVRLRLPDGELVRGDDRREDQGAGGPVRHPQGGAAGRAGREGGTLSTTQAKKRKYWAKVGEQRLRRTQKKYETSLLDAVVEDEEGPSTVESPSYAGGDSSEEDDEESSEGPRSPQVRLSYGDDYDLVKHLPRRRMKRVARKRVKGWVGKVFQALTAATLAVTNPVFQQIKPIVSTVTEAVSSEAVENVALLELFAGCGRLTEVFGSRGHTVLEPRDIIYGHDLFLEEEQERVIEDLEMHKPGLLWVALPCTKWSPWQRINYAGRKQALRRERQKQRKLIRFSVEAAKLQLEHGGMVVFEHPRWSDMWVDPSFRELYDHPLMIPVDCDMCCYNLRASQAHTVALLGLGLG